MWGSAFLFIKLTDARLSAPQLTVGRTLVAAACLAVAVQVQRRLAGSTASRWRLRGDEVRTVLMLAVLGAALPYILITRALEETDSGLAAIANSTTPLMTVAMASLLGRERAGGRRIGGLLLGLVGVGLAVGPPGPSRSGLAIGLLLAAAACYAAAFVLAASASLRMRSSLEVAYAQMVAATVLVIPLALLAKAPVDLKWSDAASVVALGVISTATPAILYFVLVRAAGSGRASSATLVVTPAGLLLGAVFLDERLQPWQWLGVLLVMAAVPIATSRGSPRPVAAPS